MKSKEFTGKTTQEAIDNGLAELGVTISEVKINVIQEGSKGLFGLFGSKPACVRITVMDDESEEDSGLSDLIGSLSIDEKKPVQKPKKAESRPVQEAPKAESKPVQAAPKAEVKAAQPAPKAVEKPIQAEAKREEKPAEETVKAEIKTAQAAVAAEEAVPAAGNDAPRQERPARAERAPRPPRPRKPRPPKTEKPAAEEKPERHEKPHTPMVPAEIFTPTEPPVLFPEGTPAGNAQRFLQQVTSLMNVKVDIYVDDSNPENLSIHMIGDTLGILIGRRGETLDALQYLTSLQVNKGSENYIRITLDTENYRAKREDSLRRLALRMANRAVKTGRKVVLEPMNPYERRILHTALQDHPDVTTHSEGEEPNRRVVITLRNPVAAEAKEATAANGEDGVKPEKTDKPKRRRHHSHHPRGPKPETVTENSEAVGTAVAVEAPAAEQADPVATEND